MSAKNSKPFEDLTKSLQEKHKVISEALDFWLPLMGLSDWAFSTTYYPGVCEENPSVAASINPSWEYMQADLKIFMPSFLNMSDKEIIFIIVHELCHCLVSTMRPRKRKHWDRELEERTVTMLSKALMRAHFGDNPQAITPPKKLKEKLPDTLTKS